MDTKTTPAQPYHIVHGPYQWRIYNLQSYAIEGVILYGIVSNDTNNYLVRKPAELVGSEPANRAFDFVTIPSPLSNISIIQQLGQTLFTATERDHRAVYHLDWNYKRIRKLIIPESFGEFVSLVFYGSTLHLFKPGKWTTLIYDLNRFKAKKRKQSIHEGVKLNGEDAPPVENAVYEDSDSDEDGIEGPKILPIIRSPPKFFGRPRARSSFGSFSESLSQSTLSDDISLCEHVIERTGILPCHESRIGQECVVISPDPPRSMIEAENGVLTIDLASSTVTWTGDD